MAEMNGRPVSRHILGLRVDVLDYPGLVEDLLGLVRSGARGRVCVANVHMVLTACDDPVFRKLVNESSFVTPDGVPLVWGLKLLGEKSASRVYGPRLMECLLAAAEEEKIAVGLYGSTPTVIELLKNRLRERYPQLNLAYSYSPPFRSLTTAEEDEITFRIGQAGVRLLFIGLGCPKQEIWMAKNEERINAVLLGVGAAFDFLSGNKAQAPEWLQKAGLEWLFRLICEPRRLTRRYLHNPRFVWLFLKQFWLFRRNRRAKVDKEK